MQFHLRYDLRNPPQWRVPFERFYATFLEQAEWADAHGFASLGLSKHHFVDDGYLPSPFAVGGAVAARTRRLRIGFNIVLLPLKHPVQVAEYARFLASDPSAPYQTVADVKQLRASGAYVVLTPAETVALGPAVGLSFHPLMGGMPHELGQESLELVAREVMPHFQDSEGHR